MEVHFNGTIQENWTENGLKIEHKDYNTVIAVPYDVPIIGYKTKTPATLRLWSARSGVLPVKRTIKNNKFLYRQPCYGWRYFMLLLCIAYDIPLVSLHVVFFEVVHCCNNLCN